MNTLVMQTRPLPHFATIRTATEVESFDTHLDLLAQQIASEVFPARLAALRTIERGVQEERQEHLFWDRLGEPIDLPIARQNDGLRLLSTAAKTELWVGGIDKPITFWEQYGPSKESLYIGPLPDDAVVKYRYATLCTESLIAVVSTLEEHFSISPAPQPLKSSDPLLVAWTPIGQYMLAAWDWRNERFA